MARITRFINERLSTKVDKLGREALISAAKTSMSSKILNLDSDFFSAMAVDSVMAVKNVNVLGQAKYPLKAINILKAHGKSSSESRLITGYALNNCRASQAMPTSVSKAKIALLDYDLRKFKMSLGVQVPWRMSARGLARTHCACGGAHLHLRAHV